MSAVFLDTVGLLALWDSADQWHPSAEAAFTVMRRLGIAQAFTNDRHFQEAEFETLF